MRTYLSEIIPKIKRYSEQLDNLTLLTGQHWVMLDDIDNYKKVFIFRNSNDLLISINGRVAKGRWEFLGNNTLLIEHNNNSFLYRHGFFDKNILALKIDGVNEYSFLINETKFEGELNSLENITKFLEDRYLYSHPKHFSRNNVPELAGYSNQINSPKYKIIKETKSWSFSTGKYVEYIMEFDNKMGTVYYDSRTGKFCYSSDKVHFFNDLNTCILSYIDFIENKD